MCVADKEREREKRERERERKRVFVCVWNGRRKGFIELKSEIIT